MNSVKPRSRASIMALGIISAFAIIIVRLFWLQVLNAQKYKALANNEQMKQYEIPASRGLIYAMNGNKTSKLVMNETVYTLFIDPQEYNKNKKDEIISTLKQVAGGNLVAGFEKLFDKDNRYQVLGKKLSRTQAEKIKEKKYSGIGFTPETRRVYPEGALASQILGFVNSSGGNYGVEASLNKQLTGKNGMLKTTTDVFGNSLMIGSNDVDIPAQNGENILLSIDRNIQAKTEKVLKTKMGEFGIKNGSAVVIDPSSGKVLAMANYPTYDPANYGAVKNASDFNNNVTMMPYENGSVIKALTMAMGINEGVASADGTYYNADKVKIEDRTIKNAVLGHTGQITFQTAINYSLNTGMVEIAKRLGNGTINKSARDKMYEYYHDRFGLGKKTGIEVSESAGIVIPPDRAEGNAVRYSNMSFGQGMDTTMIQTATAFSSIVNGGILYQPSLIAGTVDSNGDIKKKDSVVRNSNSVSSDSSRQMRDILVKARKSVNPPKDLSGYRIGGKTGTSETLVNGKYVENQTIGSYVGFGGNNSPKFVIMVSVWSEGKNIQGNIHAQPIFTEISNWLLNYLNVKPGGN
ncbi:MAG: penicillin-binding protein 2 [bacterium]|nr:penicillin-binding protein 2 [bacterium]